MGRTATKRSGARQGRYDAVDEARVPAKGVLLPEGLRCSGNIEIAHAAIVDPGETHAYHLLHGKRDRVMVNLAYDPLEREHRYGRLDGQQYAAGVRYRDILAASRGSSGASDLASVRSSPSQEHRMARMMDGAVEAVTLRRDTAEICGARGEMILSIVLGDGESFRETANRIGSEPGAPSFWRKQAGVSRVAREFREALRLLADDWFSRTPAKGLKSR